MLLQQLPDRTFGVSETVCNNTSINQAGGQVWISSASYSFQGYSAYKQCDDAVEKGWISSRKIEAQRYTPYHIKVHGNLAFASKTLTLSI